MPTLYDKLLQRICWNENELNKILISAESACSALLRRNLSIKDFLIPAIPLNAYAVTLLIQRYKSTEKLSTEDSGSLMHALLDHCYAQLQDFEKDTENLSKSELYQKWINPFLILTSSSLILKKKELISKSFKCLAKLFEEIDQCSVFTIDVYELLLYSGNTVEAFAELYYQLYLHFPIKWCEDAAYNQGSEIPLMGQMPNSLYQLMHLALENTHMRFVDLVRRLFVDIRLEQLDLTADIFIQYAWQVEDNNFFRGMLLTEHLIKIDSDNPLQAHNTWWELLLKYQREDLVSWKETKSWFYMYHLSQRILLDPSNAASYIQEAPIIEDSSFSVNKTNEIVQGAMEVLYLSSQKLIFEYMEKLGCYNVYRYHCNERFFPFFNKNLSYNTEKAINNLISLGYTEKEIIDIYMNSSLRSTYPIQHLLKQLFFAGHNITIKGRYADISHYFRDYKLTIKIEKNGNNCRLFINNLYCGFRFFSFAPEWWAKNRRYCLANFQNEQQLYGYITALDLQTLQPCLIPVLEEDDAKIAETISQEEVRRLISAFEKVIETKELTTADNKYISQINFTLPLPYEQQLHIDLLILKGCIALSDNYLQVRYMINMANRLLEGNLNRYKFKYDKKEQLINDLPYAVEKECRQSWNALCHSPLNAQEAFFIYINTILRNTIPFSEFAEHYYKTGPDVINMIPLLSQPTNYWFTGTIQKKEYVPYWNSYIIHVKPFHFCQKEIHDSMDIYSYRTPDAGPFTEGMTVFFQIGSYKKSTRTFFIKALNNRQEQKMSTPFIVFKNAMNQAAYQMNPNINVRRNLEIELPELTYRNISELIVPMLSALERRADNPEAIQKYFRLIQKNNPWSEQRNTIPSGQSLYIPKQSNIWNRMLYLLDKLVKQYEIKEFFGIYSNTFYKSYFTEQDILGYYNKKDPF